ncbi:flagellar protein FlaF [Litoreibacter meonggei]|uniref:Flagellar protein FlaF n=1 Tax=Litoreibacter meonggei TaxID=1049199 RepID=A0A497VKK2_9RHOB|nr:flagellar biosynthesis regulator FlaF [Litoreibacter meonggei]RLJ41198.1 flagellar protein FlaF [Litoreibacter meonggei]
MNVTLRAISAYGKRSTPLRTDRGIEFEVFAQVTRALTAAVEAGALEFPKLAEAVHSNRQLWTALAIDVADPGNKLPQGVRAQIFYLSEFVSEHSKKVLMGDASVDALSDINLAIMRGLNTGDH